ncbi:MAG: methyltransferase domain-containing protein [Candidatus Daviesbacteria bacterium]|nr:methyltransferase domain-containing protein [Candidatus Daviesbacteria bacterium]
MRIRLSPGLSTYDKNDFYHNWEKINKDLDKRWDAVVKNSPHKELKKATLTDLYFVKIITKHLRKWVPNEKGLKVLKLDLYNEATMTATLADWFIQRKYEYFGVDLSKEVVKLARRNFSKKLNVKNFKVGDIRKLPFKSNTFDIVFSFGTIEHIRENQQAVNEAFRVLKPGGIFITGVNNKLDMWGSYFVNELTNKLFKHITSYEPSYFPWEQRKWLKQAGFTNIKTTGMILFPHILRYTDLFIEWKNINGMAKFAWDKLIIIPMIKLAEQMENVKVLRLFGMHTTSLGLKPIK